MSKLAKMTKAPTIRHYPGELRQTRKGPPRGAVYEEDLLKENEINDTLRAQIVEVSKEELTHDADFLKIDQSKLPLEMFDSLEYEAVDKSPEEWLNSGSGGFTPFYHMGKWIWRRVNVLSYDPVAEEYQVHFLPDGIKKGVHRLNLRFEQESEIMFNDRRNVAEEARSEAKQIMRLDHFINQQPKEEVRPIRQECLRSIHERIVDGLPSYMPFPDQGTPLGSLLRNLTGDLIRWYSRTMKKAVLLEKLTGITRDEKVTLRYKQLNLPPIPPKPPVPAIGKVPCPEYAYLDRRQRIAQVHFSSQKEVLNVYKWLHDKWVQQFQHYCFMDVTLIDFPIPCTLEAFKRRQNDHSEFTMKLVKVEFRRAFMEQFLDCVQDVFDFFQSNLTVYRNGSLYKLLRVLDLKLSDFMRTILVNSLDAWLKLLTEHTQPLPFEVEEREDEQQLRTTEILFPLECKASLFQVELRVGSGKIEIEPSIEDIQFAFTQAIDKMVNALRGITSFDKDAMSLLQLDPRILLNIGAGDPLYAELDAYIRQVKTKMGQRIVVAMERPLKLAKKFEEYIWLLAHDVDDYLESFVMTDPPPTHADYRTELYKLDTAMKTILNISFACEDFGFVRVHTDATKTILATRALEMRNGLLNLVVKDARQQNIAIVQRYNSILERIAEKPANERQLADLREFIEDSKKVVEQLRALVNETRKGLGILEIYNVPLPIEDMTLSWSTLEFPSKVEASARDVEIALEEDKIRMMDKLAFEKEMFEHVIERLEEQVKNAKTLDKYEEKERNAEIVNSLMDQIQDAKHKGDDFNMREKVFGFPPTEYGILDRFIEELGPYYKLWNMVMDFHNSKNDWLNGDFKELEGNRIEEDMTEWWKGSYKLMKQLEEECPGVSACAGQLREETSAFRTHLPVIQSLASKALKRRHWDALSELLGKVIDPEDELTLQALLDLDAAAHIEAIQEVTIAAEKEYNLEKNLNGMMKEWETVEFEVKPYKESGTFVVGGIDDIVTMLDDHIVKTQTMRGSPFIKPIEKECKEWEYKLKYAQGLLDAWIACQRTWMYLEPIFGSEDIMRQLPTEARRFNGVDSLWRKTLGETAQDPNFMVQADPDKRLEEKFRKANQKLDEIQKGLNDYLEMKRLYFPRFFFLSNDELLEILSQTKEPRAVQPHLGKCFEGVNRVNFEKDLKISQMISAEGETVAMDKKVDPESSANKGNVEKWLLELEAIQWDSIRTQTVGSLDEYTKVARRDWILNWPAQVVLGVSSIFWTTEVTKALMSGGGQALVNVNQKLDGQLREMVELVRGKLNKLQRKTLGALTTIDVHNRDVVAHMVELSTHEVSDFEWMSQLRYYWEDAWKDGQAVKKGMKTVVARIVNARCLYGYEYLGNTMRLVITPLTDRCYRTMIGAVDLLYGGAPEGPAGTGKTETVKDLSKAVAIHCVVFNCSDGLDYLAMAKFFKGLAGCGSWCCFDEFNRINIEVLSVIAQQILVINQAKRENKEMFHFEGTYMKLNSNCNVFITMNPGYAGRAELPDNLKALFRPCAMMVPE